ncbi:MAG: hypothetical protein HYT15_00795 [Candidatus Magasanikbacteria bacterium]|nr:hypothetical protein [Candidatus Magasanikbacteria bacterium]
MNNNPVLFTYSPANTSGTPIAQIPTPNDVVFLVKPDFLDEGTAIACRYSIEFFRNQGEAGKAYLDNLALAVDAVGKVEGVQEMSGEQLQKLAALKVIVFCPEEAKCVLVTGFMQAMQLRHPLSPLAQHLGELFPTHRCACARHFRSARATATK